MQDSTGSSLLRAAGREAGLALLSDALSASHAQARAAVEGEELERVWRPGRRLRRDEW